MKILWNTAVGLLLLTLSTAAQAEGAETRSARTLVDQLNRRAKSVQHELRDARSHRNYKRAACLSDSLSQLHARQRLAEKRLAELKEAVARGDASLVSEKRTMLRVMFDDGERVYRGAQRCGARSVSHSGTVIRVTRPRLPGWDAISSHERRSFGSYLPPPRRYRAPIRKNAARR